ncbi:dual OB domain-containing protein [Vibrio alfacsensis]|uniref:dual OB domain-containing protein n=1 Tax=Vibrio alfacsensis TaxID=1074311 RepID=UPI004067D042
MVVLANSIKKRHRCVAGKCLETKKWIRPVGSPLGAELTAIQSSARNPYGIYPVKTLQKVNISFKGEFPLEHQPENRLVDGSEWQQRYNVSKDELSQFLDNPDSLWGQGRRVNYGDIQRKWVQVEQSLYLVQVDNLMLYTAESGSKRKAAFSYNGFDYDLPVTSPNFDDLVYKQDGLMGILCISLGENFQGNCYKIVAAIY